VRQHKVGDGPFAAGRRRRAHQTQEEIEQLLVGVAHEGLRTDDSALGAVALGA